VGLLAGDNDHAAVAATGEGRAVNRHDYTEAEIAAELGRPVVQRLMRLLRLRHDHPAFTGSLDVEVPAPSRLRMHRRAGEHAATLEVDLRTGAYTVSASGQ